MLSKRQAINNADTHCIADEHAERGFERAHTMRDAHPFSVPRLDRGDPSVLASVSVRRESRCIANVGKLAQNLFNRGGTDRTSVNLGDIGCATENMQVTAFVEEADIARQAPIVLKILSRFDFLVVVALRHSA